MTTITQNELEQINADLRAAHESIIKSETPQDGEFTTRQYMTATELELEPARKELKRMMRRGWVTYRAGSSNDSKHGQAGFWKLTPEYYEQIKTPQR